MVDFGGCNCGTSRTTGSSCDTTDDIDVSFLQNATLPEVEDFLRETTNLDQSEITDLLESASPTEIESTLDEKTALTLSEAAIVASIIINLRSQNRRANIKELTWDLQHSANPPRYTFFDPRVADNTYRLKGKSISKGASTYDVRTKGGRGVPSKTDIVSNLSKGGCVHLRTRGQGVKKSQNFADVIYGSPLSATCFSVILLCLYRETSAAFSWSLCHYGYSLFPR